MKKAMVTTQWILGIAAALSLIFAVIYKIIYASTQTLISNISPTGFLWFTATCSLASIALSLLKLCKLMEENKK
jgi:hypothetical protein